MKPIKLAQWGSTIAILAFVVYLMIMGGILLFKHPDRIGLLVTLGGIVALFIAPEKLAAFFGPALKRKQQNGQNHPDDSEPSFPHVT